MSSAPEVPVPGDLFTFWKQLLEKTRLQTSLFRTVTPKLGPELAIRQGALRWSFVAGDDSSLVVLQVADRLQVAEGPRAESGASIAERLLAHRSEIELACGARLIWRQSHDGGQPLLVIIWRVEDYGPGTTGDWPALQDALADAMRRLYSACRPYLVGETSLSTPATSREPDATGLPEHFTEGMINAYYLLGEETGYRPQSFLNSVNRHGGVEAARRLLRSSEPQEELDMLLKMHRLDISVEAFVLKPEYASLFSDDEREIARSRLRSRGYPV
jgi:hypothetical protein